MLVGVGESVGAGGKGGGCGGWDESQVVQCRDSLVGVGSDGEVEGRRGQELVGWSECQGEEACSKYNLHLKNKLDSWAIQ